MATSNFYTNNARAVYAISTHWEDKGERFNLDFEDILENIHEAAKFRLTIPKGSTSRTTPRATAGGTRALSA